MFVISSGYSGSPLCTSKLSSDSLRPAFAFSGIIASIIRAPHIKPHLVGRELSPSLREAMQPLPVARVLVASVALVQTMPRMIALPVIKPVVETLAVNTNAMVGGGTLTLAAALHLRIMMVKMWFIKPSCPGLVRPRFDMRLGSLLSQLTEVAGVEDICRYMYLN